MTETPVLLLVAFPVANWALEQESAFTLDQVMLIAVFGGTSGSTGDIETVGGLAVTVTDTVAYVVYDVKYEVVERA